MDASALSPTTVALSKRNALRFIVLLGIVSLFADMTYGSARSITGPYLALLGASATAVGIVAGPLILSVILAWDYGYREAFGILVVPAILSMAVLLAARYLFPRPKDFDLAPTMAAKGLPRVFWVYMVAIAFIAAGYADFALIAFHFDTSGVVPAAWIPLLYAIAMATDAVAALALRCAFDRVGLWTMVAATLASAAAAPLVFLGDLPTAAVGMALWGIGMGAQESVMRAAVAVMAPKDRRGTAFGIMNMIYGIAWFAGSALLGILYDTASPVWVAAVAVLLHLASLPVFFRLMPKTAQ